MKNINIHLKNILFCNNYIPFPPSSSFNGIYISLVCRSTSIACRWENVPRPTSSPLNRTLCPWYMRLPKAIASANAQSIRVPPSRRLSRPATCVFSRCGWTVWSNRKLFSQMRVLRFEMQFQFNLQNCRALEHSARQHDEERHTTVQCPKWSHLDLPDPDQPIGVRSMLQPV